MYIIDCRRHFNHKNLQRIAAFYSLMNDSGFNFDQVSLLNINQFIIKV